jgi:hypothetical protein
MRRRKMNPVTSRRKKDRLKLRKTVEWFGANNRAECDDAQRVRREAIDGDARDEGLENDGEGDAPTDDASREERLRPIAWRRVKQRNAGEKFSVLVP